MRRGDGARWRRGTRRFALRLGSSGSLWRRTLRFMLWFRTGGAWRRSRAHPLRTLRLRTLRLRTFRLRTFRLRMRHLRPGSLRLRLLMRNGLLLWTWRRLELLLRLRLLMRNGLLRLVGRRLWLCRFRT